jgi:hypothetical protein
MSATDIVQASRVGLTGNTMGTYAVGNSATTVITGQ